MVREAGGLKVCNIAKFNRKKRINQLIAKIEQERERLVELGTQKGFQHRDVLAKSRYIDDMVNEYYALITENK